MPPLTMSDLIARKASEVSTLTTERNAASVAYRTLLSGENPDEAAVATARAAVDSLDGKIEGLRADIARFEAERAADDVATERASQSTPTGVEAPTRAAATTGSEPLTYTEHSFRENVSFFTDVLAAQTGTNFEARERIQRHQRETASRMPASERAATVASFAGLIAPQYLVDKAAPVIRAGRAFANTVQHAQMPAQGTQLIIPRQTTGVVVASQTAELATVATQDPQFTNLTVNMATIAGYASMSLQSVQRGQSLDEMVYMDMARAYSAELDRQCLNGLGANQQHLGVFQTPGITKMSAYGAAWTAPANYTKFAGAVGAVAATGQGLSPRLSVMHPRRWAALTAALDNQGRPFLPASNQGPYNAYGVNVDPGAYGADPASGYKVVGNIQGMPVVTDANVPTNLGSGAAEDAELVYDSTEIWLWEESAVPTVIQLNQTAATALAYQFVGYGFSFFTAGRYPQSIAQVGGVDTAANSGQQAPTF